MSDPLRPFAVVIPYTLGSDGDARVWLGSLVAYSHEDATEQLERFIADRKRLLETMAHSVLCDDCREHGRLHAELVCVGEPSLFDAEELSDVLNAHWIERAEDQSPPPSSSPN